MEILQAISSTLGQTLVMVEGSYSYQARQRNVFIDYESLSLALGSFHSTFLYYTSFHYALLEEHKIFLKALEPTWTIKVVPANYAHEALFIRRELQRGVASLSDHIVIVSSAYLPEIDELRASGKRITRCVFAADTSDVMRQTVDEIVAIEEIPGVSFA